jgi:hypothetical protein
MRREWEPINWAAKTPRDSDWDANTRLRGLTLLSKGILLFAVWAGITVVVWGIETAVFGPGRLAHVLMRSSVWAVAVMVSGVVFILAGASMGITGVAIDKITVPSWLNPQRWNQLLFGICYFLILLLVIGVYLRLF